MLLIPHTVVAVAIATVFKEPKFVLPLALLSHFIIDSIPHWDFLSGELQKKEFTGVRGKNLLFILVDFFVALNLGLFFVWRALPDVTLAATILFAAALANLPDAVLIPRAFFGKKWDWLFAYNRLHSRFQARLFSFWGILTQVVVIAIGLLVALR